MPDTIPCVVIECSQLLLHVNALIVILQCKLVSSAASLPPRRLAAALLALL
jgi:hypothetical protein